MVCVGNTGIDVIHGMYIDRIVRVGAFVALRFCLRGNEGRPMGHPLFVIIVLVMANDRGIVLFHGLGGDFCPVLAAIWVWLDCISLAVLRCGKVFWWDFVVSFFVCCYFVLWYFLEWMCTHNNQSNCEIDWD